MTRNEVLETLAQHREEIQRFGVRSLGLFGSVARGETTDVSDLDFVVELEDKTFDAYMDLKFYLEDLFHCSVDLVLKDSIKPRLRDVILKEAVHATGL